MKRVTIFFILFFMILIIPIISFASGSILPSTTNLSIINKGTATFKITASNSCGHITISSSNPAVATANISSTWIENESITVTVTGVSAGNTSIVVKLSDAATFDEEELTGSYTINVVVTEPQTNNEKTQENKPDNNTSTNKANTTENTLSKNNNIKKLSVEGYDIASKENDTYELTVTNNVTKITINAIAEDEKATVTGAGNKNLEIGQNQFKIVVKSEAGVNKAYTLNVIRKDKYDLEDLSNVIDKIENEVIDISIEKDSIITNEILQKIVNNKKIVKLDFYNEDNKMIYCWTIDGMKINEIYEINTNIELISDYLEEIGALSNYANGIEIDFKHQGKLPKNTKIKLYVGDKYKDGSFVNLYYYASENGSLESIEKEITVSEGYIEFELEHCSVYFLTMANIKAENNEHVVNSYIIVAIIEAVLIVILLIYFNLRISKINKTIGNKFGIKI